MLALAICAVLCGARSHDAVSQWGQDCGPDIRAALGLKRERGPSGSTIHRIFRRLDHAAFEPVLGQWCARQGLHADEALAIDGKTLRGIHGEAVPGVHLVAAFAHRTRAVLAQAATQGTGHELGFGQGGAGHLTRAHLERPCRHRGCALGPAGPVPPDPRSRGDYFFVLKENQPLTLEAVAVSSADPWTPREQVVEGERHGAREARRTLETSSEVAASLAEPEAGAEEEKTGDWPGLGQVCRLHREVEYVSGRRAGEGTSEWASALTSLTPERADPARLLQIWRGQWQIENGLHDVRDVTWGEEASQIRCGQGPAVFAALRNTALGLMRLAKQANIAAAQRRYAMYPCAALALLGTTLPLLA